MELEDILNGIYPLPREAMDKIVERCERISVGKNVELVTAGTVCRYIYFVAEGIVRAYSSVNGRDITFWIGTEGSVALSLLGYMDGRRGYETIVTLEHSELYRIPSASLQELYNLDINIANWGRRFAEKEILRAEKSLIPQLFSTGRERYEALLAENPGLVNRIPQEILASYLGLTPVSLSRIRGMMASCRQRKD